MTSFFRSKNLLRWCRLIHRGIFKEGFIWWNCRIECLSTWNMCSLELGRHWVQKLSLSFLGYVTVDLGLVNYGLWAIVSLLLVIYIFAPRLVLHFFKWLKNDQNKTISWHVKHFRKLNFSVHKSGFIGMQGHLFIYILSMAFVLPWQS